MAGNEPQAAPMDRYVVLEYLAEGGMGAIYLGKKLGAGGFEKQVVLKQLLPEFTQQPEFIDLFLREARLSATLDHANIIHTIDLVTAGEDYFIVMEYLDGADLRTLLRRAKRRSREVSASAGLYIGRELLSALGYAHGKLGPDGQPLRLIHRDVSPSNILISGSGEVKLTDFGIAKASTHNSVFYRVKGKMGYMSPEQARSEPLDNRSDLYSLAVCLYEVITGERLFVNAGLTTSAEEMYQQPVPPVSSKVPGLPTELDEVMFRALALDPDQRFQTAGEFQENLLRCAHRHGLMMSAPELADHLHEACGSPTIWRDEDDLGDDIGDREGTEELDVGDLRSARSASDEVVSLAQSGPINESERRRERARTSVSKLSVLQGIELTSMINVGGGADRAGAQPLVDVSAFGRGDSIRPDGSQIAELGSASQGLEAPAGMPAPVPGTPPAQPAAGAQAPPSRGGSRGALRPLVFAAAILAVGAAITAGIGLSGPQLESAGERPSTGPREATAAEPGAEDEPGAEPSSE